MRPVFFLICAVVGSSVCADEPDWRIYEDVLQRHVVRGETAGVELHQVDYSALARDPQFAEVVKRLGQFSLERLTSRAERLAFYINAYNIFALNVVVENWPVESIKDVGSIFRPVWKRPAGILGGEPVSLDKIEHDQLRTMGEPRMHFAIVCASVSCPDLRLEPYRAGTLEKQLDEQCAAFLSNPGKGLRLDGDRAAVSKIFKWFREDFERVGGIEAFVRRYRMLPADVTIRPAIDYNWSVNVR